MRGGTMYMVWRYSKGVPLNVKEYITNDAGEVVKFKRKSDAFVYITKRFDIPSLKSGGFTVEKV